jgi:hypothetical protein
MPVIIRSIFFKKKKARAVFLKKKKTQQKMHRLEVLASHLMPAAKVSTTIVSSNSKSIVTPSRPARRKPGRFVDLALDNF